MSAFSLHEAIRKIKIRKSPDGGYDIVNLDTGQILRHAKTKSAALQVLVSVRHKVSVRGNPRRNAWKAGKWIKASAVRVRKVAGRVVMDIKKAI